MSSSYMPIAAVNTKSINGGLGGSLQLNSAGGGIHVAAPNNFLMSSNCSSPYNNNVTNSTQQQSSTKDTTYTKIFVGGLPYHTTDETLRRYFEVFGDIEEAVVITDRQTNKSRGYGFVTMKKPEEALNAIREHNPCIDGRKANVNLAVIGAKPRALPGTTPLQTLALAQLQGMIPTVQPNLNSLASRTYFTNVPTVPAATSYMNPVTVAALTAAANNNYPSLNPQTAALQAAVAAAAATNNGTPYDLTSCSVNNFQQQSPFTVSAQVYNPKVAFTTESTATSTTATALSAYSHLTNPATASYLSQYAATAYLQQNPYMQQQQNFFTNTTNLPLTSTDQLLNLAMETQNLTNGINSTQYQHHPFLNQLNTISTLQR